MLRQEITQWHARRCSAEAFGPPRLGISLGVRPPRIRTATAFLFKSVVGAYDLVLFEVIDSFPLFVGLWARSLAR